MSAAAQTGSERWALDHLVVAAGTLQAGVDWCERVLGVRPGPGGEHPLMGTHNRLLSLATPAFPLAYLEIVAVDPTAAGPAAPRRRWFGLDDPAVQQRLAHQGPQLLHWVARTTALAPALLQLRALGLEPGAPVAASRQTPRGLLQWQIALREDGQTLCRGALPTLIQWQGEHPAQHLPASGVSLHAVQVRGLPAALAGQLPQQGFELLADQGAALRVLLQTPLGPVSIESP